MEAFYFDDQDSVKKMYGYYWEPINHDYENKLEIQIEKTLLDSVISVNAATTKMIYFSNKSHHNYVVSSLTMTHVWNCVR